MTTLSAADRLMPFVIFSIPWFIAVVQIYKGLTTGKLREFRRNESADHGPSPPVRYCDRGQEPKTFWCLLMFYVLIAVLVPIGMVYAVTHPPEEPAPNPGAERAANP